MILVPVIWEGVHLFTAAAKAHQADCGNSQPTTYMPYARDVYEEGSLIFPAVRVQRDYKDIDDIIRMCRRRIRVPEQWYGDYLAMLGAARIGEARLKELCEKYGRETLSAFVEEWFDYSENRIAHVISNMRKGVIVGSGCHDPFGPAPDGIPINVTVTVDPDAGMIEIDLTDNIDCLPGGPQRVAHVRDEQLHDGRLQLDRPRHPAQRGHLPARAGQAARELRRRHPDASRTRARWPRRTWASGSSSRPSARSPTPGPATAWPRAPAASAPASRSSRAPTTARATTPTSTRSSSARRAARPGRTSTAG